MLLRPLPFPNNWYETFAASADIRSSGNYDLWGRATGNVCQDDMQRPFIQMTMQVMIDEDHDWKPSSYIWWTSSRFLITFTRMSASSPYFYTKGFAKATKVSLHHWKDKKGFSSTFPSYTKGFTFPFLSYQGLRFPIFQLPRRLSCCPHLYRYSRVPLHHGSISRISLPRFKLFHIFTFTLPQRCSDAQVWNMASSSMLSRDLLPQFTKLPRLPWASLPKIKLFSYLYLHSTAEALRWPALKKRQHRPMLSCSRVVSPSPKTHGGGERLSVLFHIYMCSLPDITGWIFPVINMIFFISHFTSLYCSTMHLP